MRSFSFDPRQTPGQIIVSFGDRRLYWVQRRGMAVSYPIAVPREQSRWQGVTSVSDKRVNPSWTPTAEMRRENPRLPVHVVGGHPMNPLGVRALYLGSSMYRIHGTDAPWTIGTAASKGCIRMYNADVLDLIRTCLSAPASRSPGGGLGPEGCEVPLRSPNKRQRTARDCHAAILRYVRARGSPPERPPTCGAASPVVSPGSCVLRAAIRSSGSPAGSVLTHRVRRPSPESRAH